MMRWQPTASARFQTQGTDAANSRGTLFVSGAATAKGSWANLGSATGFDYHHCTLCMCSGGDTADYTIDIGISDGSNRWIIAADLRLCSLSANRSGSVVIGLPLYIPSGSQISVRMASSTSADEVLIALVGCSIGFGGNPGFSRIVSMYTPATNRGTDVDPSIANTMTSWVEITSGITQRVEAIMLGVGPGAQFIRATNHFYLVDVAVGGSGSEQVIISGLQVSADSDLDVPLPMYLGPFPVEVIASQRMAVRAQTQDVTAGERKLDIALWGFVR